MANEMQSRWVLNADTGQYEAAVKSAGDRTDKLGKQQQAAGKSADKAGGSFDKLAGRMKTGTVAAAKFSAGVAAAGAAMTAAFVRQGLQSVDSLAKVSGRLGVATQNLAALRFAAEQTGVSASTLDMALQRMTRRLAEAAMGTGEARDALKELGLSAVELNRLSPDETFRRVTEAMEGVGSQSDRVRLAMKLFDSEGVSLVQTMEGGVTALDRFANEARQAGIAINEIDAAKVEAANDAMNRVRSTFSGFTQQLAVKFAPTLEAIADRLFGVAKETGGVGKAADQSFGFVIDAIGVMADGVRGLQLGWQGLKAVLQGWAVSTLRVLDRVGKAVTKWWNDLPFTDEREVRSSVEGALLTLESEFEDTMATINRLATEQLPSDQIKAFVIDVERQWEASTSAMASDTQEFVTLSDEAFESMQDRLLKARESIAKDSAALVKLSEEDVSDFQAAYDRGLERLDDQFANFFKDILRNGKISFDGLKNLFLDTIAEMAYASGGAGGGIMSGISGFGAGAANLVGQGLFKAGSALGSDTLVGLSGRAFNTANNMTFGTAIGGAAAGFAGGYLGNQVFGQTSGIGSSLGGTIGFALGGPLGAGLGSFAGAGIESLFGGQNNGDNPGRGRVNLATGQSNVFGVGKTFDQGSVDAVQGFADYAQALAQAIGGSSAQLDIERGRDYMRIGSDRFGLNQQDEFIETLIDRVIYQADQLSPALKRVIDGFEGTSEQTLQFAQAMVSLDRMASQNPVESVVADIEAAQTTAMGAYRSQLEQIATLIANFDGSAAAASELNAALAQNQQAAYQLAMAVNQVSEQVGVMFAQSAQQIRESVMSPEELFASRKAERDALRRSLGGLTDPAEIARVTQEINRLNTALFNSIDNPGEKQAEVFARYAEATNEQAQQRLDRILDELSASQSAQNAEIRDLMREAAQRQQQAADTMLVAAQEIRAAAADLGAAREAGVA